MAWSKLLSKHEIRKAHERMIGQLKENKPVLIRGDVGYQSANETVTFMWFEDAGFWFTTVDYTYMQGRKAHYWDSLGIEKPRRGKAHDIICEINASLDANYRGRNVCFLQQGSEVAVASRCRLRSQGVFLRDKFLANLPKEKIVQLEGERLFVLGIIGRNSLLKGLKRYASVAHAVKTQESIS